MLLVTFCYHLGEIAWETEAWVSDAPSHLIHFNGERLLGPYAKIKPKEIKMNSTRHRQSGNAQTREGAA
jgi:hypothetical protein